MNRPLISPGSRFDKSSRLRAKTATGSPWQGAARFARNATLRSRCTSSSRGRSALARKARVGYVTARRSPERESCRLDASTPHSVARTNVVASWRSSTPSPRCPSRPRPARRASGSRSPSRPSWSRPRRSPARPARAGFCKSRASRTKRPGRCRGATPPAMPFERSHVRTRWRLGFIASARRRRRRRRVVSRVARRATSRSPSPPADG